MFMQKTIRALACLALAFILVGCSGATVVAPPTQDVPSIRTEAVQTVVSKLTIEAALNTTPTLAATETPVPPEATATEIPSPTSPVASFTPAPTFTATVALSSGGGGGGTTGGGGGGVIYPTATRRAGPDQAVFISQNPSDGHVFHPSEEFDASWTFKNIGTKTWNKEYFIRPVKGKGTNLSLHDIYPLHGDVAPGESVTLYADMKAPSTAGRSVTYFELCNDNDEVFFGFYFVTDVK